MMRYILLGFAIYFAYRFVVGFLIPVVRTTRQVREQFNHVREQQDFFRQAAKPEDTPRQQTRSSNTAKANDGDYLDFEEIK
jgi:hypothetical protein